MIVVLFSRVLGTDCGDHVSDWISEALGRPGCRLIQQNNNHIRTSKLKDKENGICCSWVFFSKHDCMKWLNIIARQRKLKLLYKKIDIFWVFCNDIFADITKEENLSLSNESQYLLISRPSVQELLSKIKERQSNENEAGEQIGTCITVSLKLKECFYFWKLEVPVCKIAIFFLHQI